MKGGPNTPGGYGLVLTTALMAGAACQDAPQEPDFEEGQCSLVPIIDPATASGILASTDSVQPIIDDEGKIAGLQQNGLFSGGEVSSRIATVLVDGLGNSNVCPPGEVPSPGNNCTIIAPCLGGNGQPIEPASHVRQTESIELHTPPQMPATYDPDFFEQTVDKAAIAGAPLGGLTKTAQQRNIAVCAESTAEACRLATRMFDGQDRTGEVCEDLITDEAAITFGARRFEGTVAQYKEMLEATLQLWNLELRQFALINGVLDEDAEATDIPVINIAEKIVGCEGGDSILFQLKSGDRTYILEVSKPE